MVLLVNFIPVYISGNKINILDGADRTTGFDNNSDNIIIIIY